MESPPNSVLEDRACAEETPRFTSLPQTVDEIPNNQPVQVRRAEAIRRTEKLLKEQILEKLFCDLDEPDVGSAAQPKDFRVLNNPDFSLGFKVSVFSDFTK